MATRALTPRAAPATPVPLVGVPEPIARALMGWERAQLAGFVAVAIDLLDALDGDPDLEDEHDQCLAGDDGARSGPAFASGRLDYMEEGPGDPGDAEF